jgi:hypothetical protein
LVGGSGNVEVDAWVGSVDALDREGEGTGAEVGFGLEVMGGVVEGEGDVVLVGTAVPGGGEAGGAGDDPAVLAGDSEGEASGGPGGVVVGHPGGAGWGWLDEGLGFVIAEIGDEGHIRNLRLRHLGVQDLR